MRATLRMAIHAIFHRIAIFVNNLFCGSHRRMTLGACDICVFFMAEDDVGSDTVNTHPPHIGRNFHSVVATCARFQLGKVLTTGTVACCTIDVL